MHRRRFLTHFGTGLAALATSRPALAQSRQPAFTLAELRGSVSALDYDVRPGALDNQSAAFQRMLDETARRGIPVFLPAGTYVISNIKLPDGALISGVPGRTELVYGGDGHFLSGRDLRQVRLSGLVIDGVNRWTGAGVDGLIDLRGILDTTLEDLTIRGAGQDGIHLERCGGRVADCAISGAARFGIYAVESTGLTVRDNRVDACADGGIIIHRWSEGDDGTMIVGNRITNIGAVSGGTGQWGNAINLFRTDNVLVSGNRIEGAAFSAVRGNAARNLQIIDNNCRAIGETAIYSEFGFENAIVARNFIDGAANGISVTNFNNGGRAATVSGNIIRNIVAIGPYTPDAPGFGTGIAVEADTTVTGNMIEGTARFGINAGWGPYLRDCVLSSNVIRDAQVGIGISEAPGAGTVLVSANVIGARQGAIRAHRWAELTTGELLGARRGVPSNIVLADNRLA
ncbi:MAG: TIGR03808 family TAT-translocated repetitive protein [Roseitalea sp.]|jgi:uncharacterized secreted repeat protein (TIGR03808 family)|nr:TIGR03808 family TAT-translocated repetitive protein [Roseitalea sp.]MBO6720488.1 TIGR03808 family TAT-translocated repetitive protein [Roseitalea sp.]MBO6743635.1 TIGR03808 family TAT-translocated repetitive protein [Roseitalea sp.]